MSNPRGSSVQGLANSFRRLGWTGFCVQAALAILPLAMLGYLAFGRANGTHLAFGFVDYLAFLGLGMLLFTTFWSYRYTRVARRLADPDKPPSWTAVFRTLWIGVWASCIGIFVSVVLLVIEVVRLLIHFLKAPQGGVPVIRTETDDRAAWVSAMDIVSLLAELCTLIGELVIVGFTLWLLFKVFRQAGDFPPNSASSEHDVPA